MHDFRQLKYGSALLLFLSKITAKHFCKYLYYTAIIQNVYNINFKMIGFVISMEFYRSRRLNRSTSTTSKEWRSITRGQCTRLCIMTITTAVWAETLNSLIMIISRQKMMIACSSMSPIERTTNNNTVAVIDVFLNMPT